MERCCRGDPDSVVEDSYAEAERSVEREAPADEQLGGDGNQGPVEPPDDG